jgi:zinc transporter
MNEQRDIRVESPDATYGSDKNGLVWGYLMVPGQPPTPIESDLAAERLAAIQSAQDGSFLWLHFSLANAATDRWLRRHLSLPEGFFHSLGQQASSTRLEQEDEALVAVIHDALFEFTLDPESVSTVTLCMTPHFLVTARLRPVRSLDRLRQSVKSGHGFETPTALLSQLLRYQAEVLIDIVRTAATRVDHIEDSLLAVRVSVSRRDLGSLRRTLVRLQRLLAPEPAALFRLLSRSPEWMKGDDVQELRQAAEEFAAAIADSATLVERVKLLQEELAALVGEQTNRTLFALTIVTVLALPVNLVAGLFGMNVGGIPFASHQHGFLLVVTVLTVLTATAGYFALVRRRD